MEAGADIVTVLGASNDTTIRVSAEAAHKAGKKIMVDMIDVPDVEAPPPSISSAWITYAYTRLLTCRAQASTRLRNCRR